VACGPVTASTLGCTLDQIAAAARAERAPQAAGDDDLAVFGQGFANGVQAFLDGIVDEAAGVDDDQVRALEGLGGLVALGAELREDEFGVGQALGQPRLTNPTLGVFVGESASLIPLLSQFREAAPIGTPHRARKHWMQVQKIISA
jgi:hypothetical protein